MFPRWFRVSVPPLLPSLPLAVLLCLSGCGRGGAPVGEVSGQVTFEGTPVGEGRVTFQSESGAADEALLNKDGTYAIEKPMPAGEYKVVVMPLIVRERADPRGPVVGVEKPAPDIPPRYRTVGSTNLIATVKEGKNDLNFDMTKGP